MTEPALDIVGAGPSGLSAAIAARARGLEVTVYEKRPDVGARFHGDFQGLENWTSKTDVLAELEGMGIQTQFDHTPIYEIVCLSADGASHTVRASEPIFYLLRRGPQPGTLDQALKGQALAAGVAIHFDERRRQISGGSIVAEGPHRADVIATGYVFDTDMANGCYATVSDRFAPAGYSYLLIDQGRGTVATCMFRDFHNERRHLEATVDFFQRAVGLRWQSARRFGGSGNYQNMNTMRMDNHRHVGESAGFQDALFGFGLRYALISGHLAGRSVAQGGDYDQAWRSRLAGMNSASLCNRWLFERMGDWGRRWVLRRGVAGRDPRRILSRLYAPASWKTAIAGRLPNTPLHRERPQADCDCTWCRCQAAAVGAEEA
tara:strand:+ start:949 stop:2076 length:1128 start_codon:yes stop_codon:yes gene_type:complete